MIVALPRRVFSVAAAASAVPYVGAGGVYSLHVSEVTGVAAPATLRMYDQAAGPSATDPIAVIRLGANGSRNIDFPKGIKFSNGLLITATDGDVMGGVLLGSSGALKPRFFTADAVPLYTGPLSVDSVLVAEVAGAVAEFAVYDGVAVSGTPWLRLPMAANETAYYRWPQGVAFNTGITVDESSTDLEGVVYTY